MDSLSELMNGEMADIMYTDLPWGQGLIKYFNTLNRKQTGVVVDEIPLTDFTNRIFSIASAHCRGILCIEYGKKWRQHIRAVGENHGFRYHGFGIIMDYTSDLDHDVHLFSKCYTGILARHRYETEDEVISPFIVPGGIILDPCCGLGATGRLAMRVGMRFYGNELNAKRLERCRMSMSE